VPSGTNEQDRGIALAGAFLLHAIREDTEGKHAVVKEAMETGVLGELLVGFSSFVLSFAEHFGVKDLPRLIEEIVLERQGNA
jgi:hypothetical protein